MELPKLDGLLQICFISKKVHLLSDSNSHIHVHVRSRSDYILSHYERFLNRMSGLYSFQNPSVIQFIYSITNTGNQMSIINNRPNK